MKKVIDLFKPLFTDSDNLLSIGRISYWIVFAVMLYSWIQNVEHQESLTTVLMSLMAYEVFKKGRDVVKSHLNDDDTI